MSKELGFLSRFFSALWGGPDEIDMTQRAQELLASYQRELSNGNGDAEAQLARVLDQLRSFWGMESLAWRADADSSGIEVSFSGKELGTISWEPPEFAIQDSQRSLLEILAGLAAPHLAQAAESKADPLQRWQSERADMVTGLLNRPSFMGLLLDELSKPSGTAGLTSVLLTVHIQDYTKLYNALGGTGYDERVRDFSRLLRADFGLHSTAGRLEEDLFAVLISDLTNPDKAAEMSSAFRKKVEEVLELSITAGIAPRVEMYSDPQVWLNDARTAVKQAEERGGQQAFFSQTMQMHSVARWRMETDLEEALEAGQIQTWFQPIVHLPGGEIAGYEALCRWSHPERGNIRPDEFIPVAENDGQLILEIGQLTLKEACETLLRVSQRNGTTPFMSVNLSPVQLKDRKLPQKIQSVVEGAGIEASRLKLEITETAVMHEREEALQALERIRETGAQLSMDDFGTGYSSLAYLREFPITTLKIDRAFVSGADQSAEAQEILRTIVEMAHG
ncbi:MAG: GGDEF domain-containing phosphodiesterase, partial [Planctomycetota bacterium]|nr:GGDEF domain-containing phosphodiesterase [Planctomycetota bacterium]